jgi:hypothetical protein
MTDSSPVPLSTVDERRATARYVMNHYASLLTLEEKMAYKHIVGAKKVDATESASMRQMLRKVFQTDDSGVRALLADGEEAFFDRVVLRVIREAGDRIVWNLCPKCGALARTPRACLCPVCSHTWYEKRKNA